MVGTDRDSRDKRERDAGRAGHVMTVGVENNRHGKSGWEGTLSFAILGGFILKGVLHSCGILLH